ncbi:MAG: dihydroorotate dehydrogenase-like protein [Phycisphaeraceae bacterium]|nr:dihydroorotate dehydrogenase-like protein [Phycisphaeraceae bacterium]
MNLSTQYLGFELPHPLVAGAGPLTADLDMIRRLEDAGAAAIILPSLFEEQIIQEQMSAHMATETPSESYAEALSYMPEPTEFRFGPEQYLEKIRKAKDSVAVPVFGSLNGASSGGWLKYAKLIEQAGADALELNVYDLPADPNASAAEIEGRSIEMVREVKKSIGIPLAVKLSPFYSSLPNFAQQLVAAGADGIVLFNRFYQPDIDVEELEVVPWVNLSSSAELLLRLRWLAILSGQVNADLAVTGGVHTGVDAIKALMCGAHVVQTVSCLLQRGPEHLATLKEELTAWMATHEYESIRQMQGSMNLTHSPNPRAYERANYMQVLQSWRMS